jgi:hypothetical protein
MNHISQQEVVFTQNQYLSALMLDMERCVFDPFASICPASLVQGALSQSSNIFQHQPNLT